MATHTCRVSRLCSRGAGIADLADESRNFDLPGAATRLRNVAAVLHAHQRIHGNTKRLSMRNAISDDNAARWLSSAERAGRVTPSTLAASVSESSSASMISL